jgi:hypothetical protein
MTSTLSIPTTPLQTPRSVTTTGLCHVMISLSGKLSILDASNNGTGLFPLSRRTVTGAAYRIVLDEGLICWLDGDHQGGTGEINWVGTQVCTALSQQPYVDPWDEPFVCGPVLFTGSGSVGDLPVGLDDAQLRRVVDAHAAAEEWALYS